MFSAFRTHQAFSDNVLTAEFEFDSKEKVFDKPNHTYPKGISQFRTVTEFIKGSPVGLSIWVRIYLRCLVMFTVFRKFSS